MSTHSKCQSCLLPTAVPGANLNSDSVCQFCDSEKLYSLSVKAESRRVDYKADLERTIEACRNSGAQYDCLVNLSGGKDSCLLLYKLKKEHGLNVLAYTTDMNIPEIAWQNIRRTVELLDVPHVSFRPPTEFYKKMFRFLLSHQESRGAVRTVCYICAPLFEGYSLQYAVNNDIPVVFAGYAPGQPEPDRMEYEFSRDLLCNQDWTPPELVESGLFDEHELSLFWNPHSYPEGTEFPRYIAPFHAWDYSQEEAIDLVVKLGLIKNKKSASPIHSNCPINWLLMYSDLKNLGFNPYAPEFSKLIREGKASKNYWKIAGPIVDFMIRKKVFLGRNVAKSLQWLGMKEQELAITRESQGAEYGDQITGASEEEQKKKQPLQRLSVVDVLRSGVQEVPDRPAVGYRDADGTWQTLTWTQYHDQVLAIANQLLRAGVTAGDKVAIIGRSTVGWGVAEMATYCLQAVVVGLDANSSAAAIQSAGDAVDLSAIVVIGDPVKDFDYSRFGIELLLMDEAGGLVNEPNTGSDHAAGQELATLPQVSGETPATIVFTSGTTGIPKALQYTHRQMVLAINEIDREYPIINEGDSTICWLPMNHLFQRMTNLVSMLQHATIYFEPDPRQLAQTAQAVNPKVLFAVPRFLEKVAESIDEGFKKLPPPLAKYARGAFTSKDEKVKGTKRMVRRLIRKQLEKLMGRNLKYIVTGSAPLDVGVAQKIQSVGWTILEAYGVTENIVPMAANRLDCQKLGTVGKPFPANTIKISDDGEILVKGEGCISNYLHSSDSLLDEDGFYATGDLGRFDDEGFLVITGRKDSQFKTSTGRKIAPEMIENVYRQCDLVGDILVVGQGKKHLAALIVPSTSFWDTVRPMFTLDASREEIANSEAARLLLRDDLANAEGELKPHERIVEFHVIHREFDLRKGELTSSLKKRRRTIEANFRDEVEKMFCCDEPSQVRG